MPAAAAVAGGGPPDPIAHPSPGWHSLTAQHKTIRAYGMETRCKRDMQMKGQGDGNAGGSAVRIMSIYASRGACKCAWTGSSTPRGGRGLVVWSTKLDPNCTVSRLTQKAAGCSHLCPPLLSGGGNCRHAGAAGGRPAGGRQRAQRPPPERLPRRYCGPAGRQPHLKRVGGCSGWGVWGTS